MNGNRERAAAVAALEANDGVPGRTVKLEIGLGDCYFSAAVQEGRLVHVALSLSRIGGDAADVLISHQTAVLEASKQDVARALIERVCRDASELLQRQAWTAADLIAAWRGTRFDPEGVCPQVQAVVASPLDAAARWVEMKVAEGVLR